jgi:hypothetical protein
MHTLAVKSISYPPPLSVTSIFKIASADRYKTRKNPNLHPILSAETTHVRIDIRKSPSTEGVHSAAYYAYRHAYATVNRVPHIRLISEDFPWSVDIKPKFATV